MVTTNANDSRRNGRVRDNKSYQAKSNGISKDYKSKSPSKFNKNKGFKDSFENLEEDDYEDQGKGHGKNQRTSSTKSGQSIDKEFIPDKFEVMKRLENEKKVKQKKELEEESEKARKPQGKRKKLKNTYWTKGYENGLFDDDDEYYTKYM